jgi:hypothetical protein
MFTVLGKLMVFLIVTVSLLLLGWVAGVLFVQVNWYEQKFGDDGQAQGAFWRVSDRVKARAGGAVSIGQADRLRVMENRWKEADAAVKVAEAARPANRKWYKEQLDALDLRDNPPARKDAAPVPEPAYVAATGDLVLDPKNLGRPLFESNGVPTAAKDRAGRPLVPLGTYVAELADTKKQIDDQVAELGKQKKLDTELTEKIGGPKGLRVLLKYEAGKHARLDEEVGYVRPLLINTAVDADLVVRRHRSLELRKAELEAALGAAASK